MNNIVLIGMPGAGKSTIGVLVAKAVGYPFLDTDLIIQTEQDELLSDIIERDGMDTFLKIEEETLCKLDVQKHVIATGGSAVYSQKGMEQLCKQSTIIYLDVSIDEIERRVECISCRGVVIGDDKTLVDLHNERNPLYQKYANHTIDCNDKSMEEIVDSVLGCI